MANTPLTLTPAPTLAQAGDRRRTRQVWRLLWRGRLGLIGGIFLLLVALAGLLAPLLSAYDPNVGSLLERLQRPVFDGGTIYHPLGTDQLGRDIFTRIVYGARISLLVGFTAVALGGGLGVVLGMLAGYYGGRLDSIIGRVADVQLAFPFLLLAIAVVAVIGPGLLNVIGVLAIGSWMPYTRVIRGQVLSTKERDFIIAARTIGASDRSIIFRHLLPNVVTPAIVLGTFAVAATIIAEAALSFLGLGVGTQIPSWGSMLADGRAYLNSAWWLASLPGLAIMVTVLSINMIGDWVRDVLDPRLRAAA
jgi:peptide/nickel transport system permease protein